MRSLALTALALGAALPAAAEPPSREEREAQLGVSLRWQKETLTARTDDGRQLRCEPPYQEELEQVVPVVERTLREYGPSFMKRIGLRAFVFCRDLATRFDDRRVREVDGLTDERSEQAVAGLASYVDATVYVDAPRYVGDHRVTERMVHHEVFHFLDLHANPSFASDREWEALNPEGFGYSSGGVDMQDSGDDGRIGSGGRGFVSRYATAALAEDKAELWSHALAEPREVSRLAAKDAIVAAKLELLRRRAAKLGLKLAQRLPAASR